MLKAISKTKIAILTVILVAVCFYILFAWMKYGVFSVEKYDKSKWLSKISDKDSSSCYRGEMAMHINLFILTEGMSEAEIEFLLGPPSSKKKHYYEYDLGMCSGFQMDNDSLRITFDNNKRLKRSAIIQL